MATLELPLRLLLVEDDAMIGETVLHLLRTEHYAVDWVRDGAMANQALRSAEYDLVLLDLGLPKRDGLEGDDSGPGISPEVRPRVFDRFFRAGDALAETGSGLGLAIVKTIADRHGASLRHDQSARLGGLHVELRMALVTPLGSS